MPGGDRTGPLGEGPLTGRGLGPCGRGLAFRRGFGRRAGGRGLRRGFGRIPDRGHPYAEDAVPLNKEEEKGPARGKSSIAERN